MTCSICTSLQQRVVPLTLGLHLTIFIHIVYQLNKIMKFGSQYILVICHLSLLMSD